ncbi:hypothetical protein [Streptomyces sp. NPDC056512]|uniref:hypothetical protein n=1 Tax=unclassified Streptomyces TaxID=2593676 RepID=UPI00368B5544
MDFHAYMFRPGYIRPRHRAVSQTGSCRVLYRLPAWLHPILRRLAPRYTTTTGHLGQAMIAVARQMSEGSHVLNSDDINRLGTPSPQPAAAE